MAQDTIIHYHIYLPGSAPDPRFDQVLAALNAQGKALALMSDALNTLKDTTAKADTEMDAAVKVMTDAGQMMSTLAGKIASAGTDPAALAAITSDLTTHSAALTSATDSLKAAVAAQSQAATTVVQNPPATGGLTADPASGTTSGSGAGAALQADPNLAPAAKPV